jgi:hypothetical protein
MIGRSLGIAALALVLTAGLAEPSAAAGPAQRPAGLTGTGGACRGGPPCGTHVAVGEARPGLVVGPWQAEGTGRWLAVPGSLAG